MVNTNDGARDAEGASSPTRGEWILPEIHLPEELMEYCSREIARTLEAGLPQLQITTEGRIPVINRGELQHVYREMMDEEVGLLTGFGKIGQMVQVAAEQSAIAPFEVEGLQRTYLDVAYTAISQRVGLLISEGVAQRLEELGIPLGTKDDGDRNVRIAAEGLVTDFVRADFYGVTDTRTDMTAEEKADIADLLGGRKPVADWLGLALKGQTGQL